MQGLITTLSAILNVPEVQGALSGRAHGEYMSSAMSGVHMRWLTPEHTTTLELMAERVRALGFIRVGNGNYAMVLAHPKFHDVVFKVCTDPKDSYHDYIRYCEGVQNKHIPVVHAKRVEEFASIYVLDNLLPVDIEEISAYELQHRISVSLPNWYKQQHQGWNCVPRKVQGSPKYNRTLMSAARRLAKWVHKTKANWDLHNGNIMRHPATGAVVITDPIC